MSRRMRIQPGLHAATRALPIDIYGRLSLDDEGDCKNVESQLARGRAHLAEMGIPIGEELQDNSKSAFDPRVIRKHFELLKKRMREGRSGGVWVLRLDRLTRNSEKDVAELLELARTRGIRIFTAKGGELDLQSADGRAAFRSSVNNSTQASEVASERIRERKRLRAIEKRKNTFGGRPLFGMPGMLPLPEGWDPDGENEDEPRPRKPKSLVVAEREEVRTMAAHIIADKTLRWIVADLNNRGVLRDTGLPWSPTAVHRLLTSPLLVGDIVFGGEVIATLKGEPVLDRTTWDRVQAVFAARARGSRSVPFLCSGAVACGSCGDGKLRSSPEAKRRVYRCSACGGCTIEAGWLDSAVKTVTLEALSDPQHARQLAQRAVQVGSERSRLTAEIAELETLLEGIAAKHGEMLARRGADRQRLMARHDALTGPMVRQLAELRRTLSTLEDGDAPIPAEDVAAAWAAAETGGDLAACRALVVQAFPNLTLLPDPQPRRGPRAQTPEAQAAKGKALFARIDWHGNLAAAGHGMSDDVAGPGGGWSEGATA